MSRRSFITLASIGLVAALGLAAVPAYRFWKARQNETWKSDCRAAVESRDWLALEDLAGAWLAFDPDNNDGHVFLAEALVQQSDLDGAVAELAKVDDDYQGALEAMSVRAEILFSDLNRPYDAEQVYLRMLELDSNSALARQRLIYFYAMTLQRSKMIAQILDSMQRHREPPEAYPYLLMANSLNFSDGLAIVSRWRNTYPDDQVLEAAQATYAAKQDPEKAMATFGSATVMPGDRHLVRECLTKYPSNIELLAVHIDQAMFEGDTKRVTELLKQSPPEAEHDSRFWRFRGWLLSTQGRNDRAEAAFRKALELHPFEWQSRWLLSEVLRKMGRREEADQAAKLALEGKDLQTTLFERENARDLDQAAFDSLYHYLKQTGPDDVIRALEFRMSDSPG